MHAYVKFTDGWQLILPTSLIRSFSPRNDEDFDATRIYEAYWVSDCGDEEDYYDAHVLLLGGKFFCCFFFLGNGGIFWGASLVRYA